jgi:hypothetical protein
LTGVGRAEAELAAVGPLERSTLTAADPFADAQDWLVARLLWIAAAVAVLALVASAASRPSRSPATEPA